MKYSEFEKRIRNISDKFEVDFEGEYASVIEKGSAVYISRVSKVTNSLLNLTSLMLDNLGQDEREEIIRLSVELAFTPLKEREDEKKYWVLDSDRVPILCRSVIHVAQRSLSDRSIDHHLLFETSGIYRFTEQEIRDYDERYMAFAVEVEE